MNTSIPNKWCEHEEVRAVCDRCKLMDQEIRIEQLEAALAMMLEMYPDSRGSDLLKAPLPKHETVHARKVALLHRLRRHRDSIAPDTYHSCHAGCMQEDCLIVSALRFIEETHRV